MCIVQDTDLLTYISLHYLLITLILDHHTSNPCWCGSTYCNWNTTCMQVLGCSCLCCCCSCRVRDLVHKCLKVQLGGAAVPMITLLLCEGNWCQLPFLPSLDAIGQSILGADHDRSLCEVNCCAP